MVYQTLQLIWKLLITAIFTIKYAFYYKLFGNRRSLTNEQEEDIKGEVVVITGANRGIGKQLALEMAKRKAIVVFGCRNIKVGEEAVNEIQKETGNNNLDLIHLDLMDMDSVERFAREVCYKYPTIKLLVNNAGVSPKASDRPNELTKEGFNPHMAANHLGHFLLTNLLLDNLRRGSVNGHSRVISVTSMSQGVSQLNTDDLMMQKSGFGFADELPYANTKHANSLMINGLAKRMKNEKSKVYAYSICPAFVYTEIYEGISTLSHCFFGILLRITGLSPSQAVTEYLIHICLSKEVGEKESGLMFYFRRPCPYINRKLARENKLSENLWDLSAKLVKLDERLPHPAKIIPKQREGRIVRVQE